MIASGPSTTQAAVDAVRGFRTIVVNSTALLAPWADVLYAADPAWWNLVGRRIAFEGLRVCPMPRAQAFDPRVRTVSLVLDGGEPSTRMQFGPGGEIGHGCNSGFQAANLAVQFGARRLVLIGFDFKYGPREAPHHHGEHVKGLRNPTAWQLAQWGAILNAQADTLCEHGVEVVNASPVSALTAFPQREVQDVANEWLTSLLQAV